MSQVASFEIVNQHALSKLIFLSDMYRHVLDVEGDVLHLGSDVDPWHTLWSWLRDVYEVSTDRRMVVVPQKDSSRSENESESVIPDLILSHIDEGPLVVALCYFDNCTTSDISSCLRLIVPYLTMGSIVAFSMTSNPILAIQDIIGLNNIHLQRWHTSRKDCYAIVG